MTFTVDCNGHSGAEDQRPGMACFLVPGAIEKSI